ARELTCLIQVNLDTSGEDGRTAAEGGRGGAAAQDVPALADALAAAPALSLGGVMAVAPLVADPGEAFARLAHCAAAVRAAHPGARILSAGMSADLEAAVIAGATHVRVGTAVLGMRPRLR